MELEKKDFTYTNNKGGYMIHYKGKPIGGAGTLTKGSNLRGRAAVKQSHDYAEMARYDIDRLVSGNGNDYYKEVINKINNETEKN
jgi:hypothetical protein